MLLAVTVGPVAALLGFVAVAVVCFAIGALFVGAIWAMNRKPAAPPSGANPLSQQATLAAFVAQTEGLGVFKNLFKAIAANDRENLYAEAQYLSRVVKESGSFASTLEQFVLSQLKQRLLDPARKRSLLDFIGATLGVDVHAAIDNQVKATAPPSSPAIVPALLLGVALLFGMSTASAAAGEIRGPQLHEASEAGPVIDPPTFPERQAKQLQIVRDVYGRLYYVTPQPAASVPYAAPSWKRLGDLTFDDQVYHWPASQPNYAGPYPTRPAPCLDGNCPPWQSPPVNYRRRWRR